MKDEPREVVVPEVVQLDEGEPDSGPTRNAVLVKQHEVSIQHAKTRRTEIRMRALVVMTAFSSCAYCIVH